jgi:hypothetical protein
MNKEKLKVLTIEQLNEMSENQLDITANEVVAKLTDYEIEMLSSPIKEKLKLKRGSVFGILGNKETWITLIIGTLIATIIGAILGK